MRAVVVSSRPLEVSDSRFEGFNIAVDVLVREPRT